MNRESYGGDETVTQLETEINGEKQMISVDVLPLTYDAESIEEALIKDLLTLIPYIWEQTRMQIILRRIWS